MESSSILLFSILGFTLIVLVGFLSFFMKKFHYFYNLQPINVTNSSSSQSPSPRIVIKELPSVFLIFSLMITKIFYKGNTKKNKNSTVQLFPLQYELSSHIIQSKHVLDYCKICGFQSPSSGGNKEFEVPLTYPQLLGFRMQLLLFLNKLFPFPAMGLVHMTNSVKQYKKVLTGMKVNVIVRCEDKLIIHPKGYCFDIICEIYSTDSKPILLWSSTSTYLTRKSHQANVQITYESAMNENDTTDLKDILEPWKLKGDLGRKYASVSEDYNPIHLTAITASFFGFSKGCIAHGLWTSSKTIGVLSTTSPSLLSTDSLVESSKYLEYYVEYKTPIFLPNTVILTGKQEDSSSSGRFIVQVVSAKDKSKPHMKGYLVRKNV